MLIFGLSKSSKMALALPNTRNLMARAALGISKRMTRARAVSCNPQRRGELVSIMGGFVAESLTCKVELRVKGKGRRLRNARIPPEGGI